MQQLNYTQFKTAMFLTGITALILLGCSFLYGKINFFLLLNADLGKPADLFFRFWTNMGDGLWWVVVLILFILFKKKRLPLLIGSFICSELLIQLFKSALIPDEARPTKAITDGSVIHTVPGVELHLISSFPSGHTVEIFTFFLLACLLINKRWIIPIGFVYALLVGYSRIYLAQHFPLDVGGGMIIAMISVSSALFVTAKLQKRKP
jgi:membrane-associated phospholipid phosphatase